eukprot:8407447-Ditylum_brightwellii.AAC.2
MQQKMAKQMAIIQDMQAQLLASVQNIVNQGMAQMRAAAMPTASPASMQFQTPLMQQHLPANQLHTDTKPPAAPTAPPPAVPGTHSQELLTQPPMTDTGAPITPGSPTHTQGLSMPENNLLGPNGIKQRSIIGATAK